MDSHLPKLSMYSVEIRLVVKTKDRSTIEKVEVLFQTCGTLTQHWKMETKLHKYVKETQFMWTMWEELQLTY